MTVVRFEVPGIQEFIFRGRTLLDAIGRSWYVEQLTTRGFITSWPEWDDQECELILGAAGMGIVDVPDPVGFTRWLTDSVAKETDALTAVVDHVPVGTPVLQTLREAKHSLRLARLTAPSSQAGTPFWGALNCYDTGSPAENLTRGAPSGEAPRPLSGEVARFRAAGRNAHKWYTQHLLADVPTPSGASFALPSNLDQLGRATGESSHVAVVVADLNGLGRTLRAFAGTLEGLDDPDALSAWSEVSAAIRECQMGLARSVVTSLAENIRIDSDESGAAIRAQLVGRPAKLAIDLVVEEGSVFLPVRPWVAAGDDLVLVCESRIAFRVADIITAWLDRDPEDDADPRAVLARRLGAVPSIGLGIAVAPLGYPLGQAHDLAADLCENAKIVWRKRGEWPGAHHVDWHLGPHSWPVVQVRRQADGVDAGPLATGRAHRNDACEDHWRTLFDVLLDPGNAEGSLRGEQAPARSWIKSSLATAVMAGDDEVDMAVETHNTRQVVLRRPPFAPASRDRHLLHRSIELMDDHLATEVEN